MLIDFDLNTKTGHLAICSADPIYRQQRLAIYARDGKAVDEIPSAYLARLPASWSPDGHSSFSVRRTG